MELSIKACQQLGVQTASFLAYLKNEYESLVELGEITPSEGVEIQRKDFVEAFNYSHNSQIRYERQLEDAKLVTITTNRGSGRGNLYKLNVSAINKLYA